MLCPFCGDRRTEVPDQDDDDKVVFKVDWIAAGILFFRVRSIDGEKGFAHCPEVSEAFAMKVTAIDIFRFEFDVVWLEYFEKNLRAEERNINAVSFVNVAHGELSLL